MRSKLRALRQHLREVSGEFYFFVTPLSNPLAAVNDLFTGRGASGMDFAPVARRGAVTACDQARQVCRHVDIARQKNPALWRAPLMPLQSSSGEQAALRAALDMLAQQRQLQ